MHPFLDEGFHVRWSTLVPEAVEPDIRHALELAKANLEAICQVKPGEATYENTFAAFEKANDALNLGWGRLQHLDSVCDEPAQRAALNAMLPEVSEHYAAIPLNPRLWAVLKAFGESPAAAALPPVEKRFVEETMLDFAQSGADLPPDQKDRVAAVEAELSKLTKQYSEHVLDATNAWDLVITDEAKLAGLPTSAKAAALANATAKGLATDEAPAWRFTLQMPSMFPLMQHLDDDGIRRQVWEASVKVASEGGHDNTSLVWQILELRREKAALLGHDHFADLTLQRRMARNGETALKFTEDLHDRIQPAFQAEYRALCDYKSRKTATAVDGLQPWEFAYWSEKRRQEEYDLDDEALRPYFPVDRVMGGMFDLCTKLFGIAINERPATYYDRGSRPADAPADAIEVWHPEVKFYDLLDGKSGEHLGSFYADWHPRESKRGGAWMNCLFTGHPGGDGAPREPHLGLIIGNMTPPVGDQPALLTHSEVETIFHEFGHLLHGLLSEVSVRSLAGTNVPWDFVELPSQIMENFCWDRQSLDLFARHHQTGEPIPDALFDRMIAARNYLGATTFMRQLAFGKLDLELHIHLDRYAGRDLDEVDREILASYRVPMKTDSPSMARRFNHLFSSPTGYAAGYYSYKWAEVLDADAFTRFQENGVIDPETGAAFREHILSKGNSAPVDELYRRFMGRDPELEPLLVRSGLSDCRLEIEDCRLPIAGIRPRVTGRFLNSKIDNQKSSIGNRLFPMRSGILYLVSGPSGSGKSTLCRRLAAEGEAEFSVSCTTRAPRFGETHGKEYFFLTKDEFTAKVAAGDFLEHALVHGNYYGTLRSEVLGRLAAGTDVVMDIDVQGAAQVRACEDPAIRLALVDLFVMPPDEAELARRLRGRGTDSDEVIALRLHNAIGEMSHWPEYRYRLLSATPEEDFERFKSLLVGERLRVSRLRAD